MTPQVKDLDPLLAPAIPSTSASFPPSPPTSTASTTSASFFEDISHLEDPAITDAANTNISGSDRSPYETAPCPSESPPNATLTPMQLVTLSNLKLNSDMFSNRSLSIHRRILVKNFLTLLYQLNPPMDWVQMQMQMQQIDYGGDDFGPIPGLETGTAHEENMLLREDEQNGWMERTLSAAGLSDKDDVDADADAASKKPDPSIPTTIPTTAKSTPATRSAPLLPSQGLSTPLLSPAGNSTNTAATQDPDVPLPRPKSAELPQSLHTYLSAVFDVDWSVALPGKEDLLFTHAAAGSSPSSSHSLASSASSSSSPSPVATKRKSISVASRLQSVSNASSFTSAPTSELATSSEALTDSTLSLSAQSAATSLTSYNKADITNGHGTGAGAGAGAGMGMGSTLRNPAEWNTGPAPTSSSNSNNTAVGTKAAHPATSLVRKSSLPSSHAKNNNNAGNNAASASGNTYTTDSNSLDGRNSPVRNVNTSGHSKPILLPGRRSSLLQTGQMPPALPSSSSNSSNNHTNNLSRMNSVAATTAHDLPRSPSTFPSPSPSSATLHPPPSPVAAAVTSSTSPPLLPVKPAFSRRTSSLPAERPKAAQRAPSSESSIYSSTTIPSTTSSASSPTSLATTLSVPQANIIGLPRPLLNPIPSSSDLMSSSPPSPPALAPFSMNTSRQQSQHSVSPRPYARSVSDDHFLPQSDASHSRNGSLTPERLPSSSQPPRSFSNNPLSSVSSPNSPALSRPSPTYLKASKSSPCLVSESERDPEVDSGYFVPDVYHQQLYQQSFPSQNVSQAQTTVERSGPKALARSSSRGAMSSSGSNPRSTASSHGTMNISAPLPLTPDSPSYNDGEGYERSPYSHGHAYARSMSNVSVVSSNTMMTGGSNNSRTNKPAHSQDNDKPANTGRWSSMKMMLGLRVGQGTKI